MNKKVIEIVYDVLKRADRNLDKNSITSEKRVTSDLGADSLDKTEILYLLEDEYDIVFPVGFEKKDYTVGDLETQIKECLSGNGEV